MENETNAAAAVDEFVDRLKDELKEEPLAAAISFLESYRTSAQELAVQAKNSLSAASILAAEAQQRTVKTAAASAAAATLLTVLILYGLFASALDPVAMLDDADRAHLVTGRNMAVLTANLTEEESATIDAILEEARRKLGKGSSEP